MTMCGINKPAVLLVTMEGQYLVAFCTQHTFFFDVLLTVHLSIFISVINQLDAQNVCFTVSLFHASGTITPIGVMIPEAL